MTACRSQFLARCTVSDVECLDATRGALHALGGGGGERQAQYVAQRRTAVHWPAVGHACDFCGTWPSHVARCDACARWLGLADCECAAERCRRTGGLPFQVLLEEQSVSEMSCTTRLAQAPVPRRRHSTRLVERAHRRAADEQQSRVDEQRANDGSGHTQRHAERDERDNARSGVAAKQTERLCKWCDSATPGSGWPQSPPPPQSVGWSRGLLRRVVFVLEPPTSAYGAWHSRVAPRLAEPLIEEAGGGTVLVYGVECADAAAWCDALTLVQQFALEPRRHLPRRCRWAGDCDADDDGNEGEAPGITLVLATHSTERHRGDGAGSVRLDTGGAEARSVGWWCDEVTRCALSRRAEHRMRVDTLHVLTCHLFAPPRTDSAARLQQLADECCVAVMACDGEVMPFVQVALTASLIIARAQRRAPPLACTVRRFQPHAATLALEPRAARVAVTHYHQRDVDGVVAALATAATQQCEDGNERSRRTRKRSRVPDADEVDSDDDSECLDGGDVIVADDQQAPVSAATLAAHRLAARWPWRRRADDEQRTTSAMYERLFAAARLLRRLLDARSPPLTIDAATALVHRALRAERASATVRRQLLFLRRLLHDGLAAPPLRVPQQSKRRRRQSAVPTSLEQAVASGIVTPPLLAYVRNTLDMPLFETALPTLRRRWRALWSERAQQRQQQRQQRHRRTTGQ